MRLKNGPMNHKIRTWRPTEIHFDILDDLTDHPIVTIFATTPAGVIEFMGEPVMRGRMMIIRGAHLQTMWPQRIGVGNLYLLARMVMERMDIDGLTIEGSLRTTGANPGRKPEPIRFTRPAAHHPCHAAFKAALH
jgi:hypothetical protein